MTADPSDAQLAWRCLCGQARRNHSGRTGRGRCYGHPIVTPALTVVGSEALGGGDLPAAPDLECPTRCIRFRHDPDDRLLRRAIAAANDEPWVALRAYSRRRDRARTASKVAAGAGWSVGPSDLSGCKKAVEFRERPPEGHVPIPLAKDAAAIGTMLHEEYTRARRRRYPWRRFKVTVTVPGMDRPGEADEVDFIIGRVTDYKSAGDWKWDQVGKHGPPLSEWRQVATYAFGLAEAGQLDPHDLEIVYINREKGTTERFVKPYVRALAIEAVAELHGILNALDEGRPLPREMAGEELMGPSVNGICARFCPHVVTCWNLLQVPPDRSPEGWLLLRDDDEDGSISLTLANYDANRTVKSEAGRQQDYAKVLVQGLEPGRYGDFTLKWSGGNLGEEKPDVPGRVAQLEGEITHAAEEGRAPRAPGDLPWPTYRKRSATSIQVKAVRAAKLEREGAG